MCSKRVKLDFKKFYCDENASISKEASKFSNKSRNLPLEELESMKINTDLKKGPFIVNWFRNDLRIQDNTSLYNSIKVGRETNRKVIGLYIISTKFLINHLESPWKIKLIEIALKQLSIDLEEFNIPLSIIYLNDHDQNINFTDWFKDLLNSTFKTNSVSFNLIYDFNEMKRDINLIKSNIEIEYYHDSCVLRPLTLETGKKTQYTKFSPWYKKWLIYLNSNPFELLNLDPKTDKFEDWDLKEFKIQQQYSLPFDLTLSSLKNFGVSSEDIKLFHSANSNFTERSAQVNLENWLSKNVKKYIDFKDFPTRINSTSNLSSYLTIGLISARQVYKKSEDFKKTIKDKKHKENIDAFLREVAFRDFYKHVLVNWPYIQFNLPYNIKTLNLKWDTDYLNFEKWALGKTGFPIIDATMRKLLKTGYINNRCRMIVASFLSKDLNQDWRLGQNWFHYHLIDGDYSSNSAGWQWCSSVGIDGQPWFRIFNVYTQSKKFDPDGDFIREWVEELAEVKDNKKIHTGEGVEGYILPIVNREEARQACLERYKEVFT